MTGTSSHKLKWMQWDTQTLIHSHRQTSDWWSHRLWSHKLQVLNWSRQEQRSPDWVHQMLFLPTEIVTHTFGPIGQKTHKIYKNRYILLIHRCVVLIILLAKMFCATCIYYLPLCQKFQGLLFSKGKTLSYGYEQFITKLL